MSTNVIYLQPKELKAKWFDEDEPVLLDTYWILEGKQARLVQGREFLDWHNDNPIGHRLARTIKDNILISTVLEFKNQSDLPDFCTIIFQNDYDTILEEKNFHTYNEAFHHHIKTCKKYNIEFNPDQPEQDLDNKGIFNL